MNATVSQILISIGIATSIIGGLYFVGLFLVAALDVWWMLYKLCNGGIRQVMRETKKNSDLYKEFQQWKIKSKM